MRRRVTVVHRNPAAEAAAAQRRREWRDAQRRDRQAAQTTPMPTAVWWALGVLALVALVTLNIAALPGLTLIGLGCWVYASRRRARVTENLARRDAATRPPPPGPTGFEGMAATYDQAGMPQSAAAYRDLARMHHDEPGGPHGRHAR